jgi:Stress responsive A/B Barrel Domain
MKNISIFTIILTFIMMASIQSQGQQKAESKSLRHVVMFKFKDGTPPADVKKVEDAFAGLAKKIRLIKQFEWGTNNSPENLNQGLTHCFFVTFSSEKDRDDYLVHPEHQAFVEVLKPHLDKVTVLDYWAK